MPQHFDPSVIIDATLYTLLAFSIVTWVIILYKVWQFSKTNHCNECYSKAFWDANDMQAAENLPVEIQYGTTYKIASMGFKWLSELNQSPYTLQLKFQGSKKDSLVQALRRQVQIEQGHMESGLTMLASIGSTSPFVGLFGTVLGIMHAMHQISASGSSSLEVVAGPIGDALIATAIGIAVAVPAVLAYNFFIRKSKQHRAVLENFAESFVLIATPEND